MSSFKGINLINGFLIVFIFSISGSDAEPPGGMTQKTPSASLQQPGVASDAPAQPDQPSQPLDEQSKAQHQQQEEGYNPHVASWKQLLASTGQKAHEAEKSAQGYAVSAFMSVLAGSNMTGLTIDTDGLRWRMYKRLEQEPVHHDKASPENYIALCTCVKEQGWDLPEWLDHHFALGVSKVYLFDDHSHAPVLPWVLPYLLEGKVEYSYLWHPDYQEYEPNPQLWAFQQCIVSLRDKHQWIGFIDIDEYTMLTAWNPIKDLPTFLKNYEAYPGLGVIWKFFPASGHMMRPAGGTVRNYVECYPTASLKTYGNTDYLKSSAPNPHVMMYHEKEDGSPRVAVNELFEVLDGPHMGAKPSNLTQEHIFLAHYTTKSLQDFLEKSARGRPMRLPGKGIAFFQTVNKRAAGHNCTDLVKHYFRTTQYP